MHAIAVAIENTTTGLSHINNIAPRKESTCTWKAFKNALSFAIDTCEGRQYVFKYLHNNSGGVANTGHKSCDYVWLGFPNLFG